MFLHQNAKLYSYNTDYAWSELFIYRHHSPCTGQGSGRARACETLGTSHGHTLSETHIHLNRAIQAFRGGSRQEPRTSERNPKEGWNSVQNTTQVVTHAPGRTGDPGQRHYASSRFNSSSWETTNHSFFIHGFYQAMYDNYDISSWISFVITHVLY